MTDGDMDQDNDICLYGKMDTDKRPYGCSQDGRFVYCENCDKNPVNGTPLERLDWMKTGRNYEAWFGNYRFLIMRNKENIRHDGVYHFYTIQVYREGRVHPIHNIQMTHYLKDAKQKCVDYYNENLGGD